MSVSSCVCVVVFPDWASNKQHCYETPCTHLLVYMCNVFMPRGGISGSDGIYVFIFSIENANVFKKR